MFIVRSRIWFFILSALLVATSLYGMISFGFNLGIDFQGGTLTEVSYKDERSVQSEVERNISDLDLGGFSVRPAGEKNFIVRTRELSEEERQALLEAFGYPVSQLVIERQNTVGPVAGRELRSKATIAIIAVVFMIVLFVTFAFRKAQSSWKYGLATIIALFHDIMIPTGAFAFLGHLYGLEIDLLFVSGLLAILGYSVHDTIVVFDRVRENLRINKEGNIKEEFEITVGKSVMQTLTRSINTSLTLLIVLFALYFVGSSATSDFSLLLIIGVIAGTYSSIFLASPLLVTFNKLRRNK